MFTFILICAECMRKGVRVELGTQLTAKPPFAITVMNGDALCADHVEV